MVVDHDIVMGLLARSLYDPSLTTEERLTLVADALAELRPSPSRPDIHWENDSEGAHYASVGCCRFGPSGPCTNVVKFRNGVLKEELLFEDGSCKSCGARYHCASCGIGTGMMGHNGLDCLSRLPKPPGEPPHVRRRDEFLVRRT